MEELAVSIFRVQYARQPKARHCFPEDYFLPATVVMTIDKIEKFAYYKDTEHIFLWQRSIWLVLAHIVISCVPERNEAALRCCVLLFGLVKWFMRLSPQ